MPIETKKIRSLDQAILGTIYGSPLIPDLIFHLCDRVGPRFAGTDGERQGAEQVGRVFESFGMAHVTCETFPITAWKRSGPCHVEVTSPVQAGFPATALPYSPSTPGGGLTAELVVLPFGTPEEFSRAGSALEGAIVLTCDGVPPGYGRSVHRAEKYGRAVEAGAAAFLFAHRDPGGLDPTGCARFSRPAEIPAAGISFENAERLKRLAAREPTRLTLVTAGECAFGTSVNVTGEIRGREEGGVILVGGHQDTHDICPGAIDNTSGICVISAAAQALAALPLALERTVRFAAFGAEEIGLQGSTAMVERLGETVGEIGFMINVDCPPASRPVGLQIYDSDTARPYFEALSRDLGLAVPVIPGLHLHSDHFPFFQAGVPVANLAAVPSGRGGARSFAHTIADTPDKIDVESCRYDAALLARVLLRLGTEDELPLKRRSADRVREVLQLEGFEKVLRYEG